MIIGTGDFRYEVVETWAKWPEGWDVNDICGLRQNSKGVFYIFNRGEHPIVMLGNDGNFLGSWGEGEFGCPHGISIAHDDSVWLTDIKLHTVRKFTPDGELLMELGKKGQASDSGCTEFLHFWDVRRGAAPFNEPTQAVEAPWGDIYVTDGYGNARVHVFSPDGKLKLSWGEPGSGAGQFNLPHDIAVDEEGTVFVTDRENSRIQLFTRDGKFIEQWTRSGRPTGLAMDKKGNFFIPELGAHMAVEGWPYPLLSPTSHVRIRNHKGDTLAILGEAPDQFHCCAPGYFYAAHACCVDADDNLYIGEPIATVLGHGLRDLPLNCHALQKFARIG